MRLDRDTSDDRLALAPNMHTNFFRVFQGGLGNEISVVTFFFFSCFRWPIAEAGNAPTRRPEPEPEQTPNEQAVEVCHVSKRGGKSCGCDRIAPLVSSYPVSSRNLLYGEMQRLVRGEKNTPKPVHAHQSQDFYLDARLKVPHRSALGPSMRASG